jgi:hypothetical protein
LTRWIGWKTAIAYYYNQSSEQVTWIFSSFSVMNAQVTNFFWHFWNIHWRRKYWKLQTGKCYIGQWKPIWTTFDASIVYGPVLDKCITWVCDLKLNNLKKNKDEK